MKTPTWCNTVRILFLQSHSTCFGRKRPSSGVFKASTAATGTCVIVAGQSSHLLIRAEVKASRSDVIKCIIDSQIYFKGNTNLMQHCAGFISAVHSTCFGRKRPSSGVPALIRRCDDWPATITHVPVAAVLVLNTPDDGCLTPDTCRVTLQKENLHSVASSWCFHLTVGVSLKKKISVIFPTYTSYEDGTDRAFRDVGI